MRERKRKVQADGAGREELRSLELAAALRGLVERRGRMEAAAALGVNYKTLARAAESGRITERMRSALERFLGSQDADGASNAPVGVLEERLRRLDNRLDALEEEARRRPAEPRACAPPRETPSVDVERITQVNTGGASVAVQGASPSSAHPRVARNTGAGRGGSPSLSAPEPSGRAGTPTATAEGVERSAQNGERLLAQRNGVATRESAPDDAEVFGDAWPLVKEWRTLQQGHPVEGRSLSWLAVHERLLAVELAMLQEHRLTLPPETQPLYGLARGGQINWRRAALRDTRRALLRRRALRWARRIFTLGLWRR